MAKSKNRYRGCPPPSNGSPKNNAAANNTNNKKGGWCATNIDLTQEAIDRHWQALPAGTKDFVLSSSLDGMFSLSKLLKFWDSPANRECTEGGIAGSMCGAMWYLAMVHLRLGAFRHARALTVNGAFIHQCYNSSIDKVKQVYHHMVDKYKGRMQYLSDEYNLPYFSRGCAAVKTPESIKMYIERYLPKEYSQMMTSFANLSSKTHVNQYCSQIGEDWATGSSTTKRKNNSRSTTRQASSNVDAQQIKITLVDDTNEAERQTFDIGSSTTLKSLFNDYAEKRAASLRMLRFSFGGKTLFLSSAGHKTPEEMGMHDEDVIMVHDMTEKPQEETTIDDSSKASPTKKCKPKKNKSSNKKGKKKSMKKRSSSFEEPTKTLKEYKIDHSRQLTKIHEEASDQFKQIRQKLNNLDIERCPKKNKKRSNKSSKNKSSGATASQPVIMNPSKEGLGGKAGKSHFVVQVGEVENLYKSTKSSQQLQQQKRTSSMTVHTLDLHGLTVDEALVQLDESLQTWVKTAMEGCYPFVQPAVIICGCGNQVLSEVVSDWIRNNDKVSNATKSFTRSIGRASAA